MSEGGGTSLDVNVAELRRQFCDLDGRVERLEDHREEHVDPTLVRHGADITEIRATLLNCATKDHVIAIMQKIDEGNQNMATALKTPSSTQERATWAVAIIGSIAMIVGAIAAFHK
jgi:hypothetical protein